MRRALLVIDCRIGNGAAAQCLECWLRTCPVCRHSPWQPADAVERRDGGCRTRWALGLASAEGSDRLPMPTPTPMLSPQPSLRPCPSTAPFRLACRQKSGAECGVERTHVSAVDASVKRGWIPRLAQCRHFLPRPSPSTTPRRWATRRCDNEADGQCAPSQPGAEGRPTVTSY